MRYTKTGIFVLNIINIRTEKSQLTTIIEISNQNRLFLQLLQHVIR